MNCFGRPGEPLLPKEQRLQPPTENAGGLLEACGIDFFGGQLIPETP
jgi:hypothetical protein